MKNNKLKRIIELCEYKIHINEWGKVDTNGYICVGEVPFYPFAGNKRKMYIMVSPQKEMKWGEEMYNIVYTENEDGSGAQTDSVPNYAKDRMTIYPEHMDDEYGEIFLGKRKGNEIIEKNHNEFLSKLFIIGGSVVLHHYSNFEIKDGVVRKGEQQGYSNNSDIGIYFWGSRHSGSDPSNYGKYIYYCLISKDSLYDFETNVERLTLPNAMKKYEYCGQYWKDKDAVVVTTYKPTTIWCILDTANGKWFDKEWNQISKPF